MSEGTKIGEYKENAEFNAAVTLKPETEGLKATKLGELSEFEKGLQEEDNNPKGNANERQSNATPLKLGKEKNGSEDLSFEQAMSGGLAEFEEDEIVEGTVRSIEKGGVLIDINYKSDGFILNSELLDDEVLKPGDKVKVLIEKLETKEGYTILSRKKAIVEEAWNELVECNRSKQTVAIKVVGKVQGGLVSVYKGIKGFIPASQALKAESDKLDDFLGQTLQVAVLQVDRRRRKVIFSHKIAQSKLSRQNAEKTLDSLEIGETRTGKVTSVKDFGVFVDIGGLEGLVHISELSWSRVNHPSEYVSPGDEVKVFILGIDKENSKISLGMKQLEADPWVNVSNKYKVGQLIEGEITRTAAFGAFIKIEQNLEGLIHISELANEHVEKVEDVVKPKQIVTARIIKLIPEEQKIGLSLKSKPEEKVVEAQPAPKKKSNSNIIAEVGEDSKPNGININFTQVESVTAN